MWLLSGYSGFLLQSTDPHVGLTGDFQVTKAVNASLSLFIKMQLCLLHLLYTTYLTVCFQITNSQPKEKVFAC